MKSCADNLIKSRTKKVTQKNFSRRQARYAKVSTKKQFNKSKCAKVATIQVATNNRSNNCAAVHSTWSLSWAEKFIFEIVNQFNWAEFYEDTATWLWRASNIVGYSVLTDQLCGYRMIHIIWIVQIYYIPWQASRRYELRIATVIIESIEATSHRTQHLGNSQRSKYIETSQIDPTWIKLCRIYASNCANERCHSHAFVLSFQFTWTHQQLVHCAKDFNLILCNSTLHCQGRFYEAYMYQTSSTTDGRSTENQLNRPAIKMLLNPIVIVIWLNLNCI